MCPHECTPVSTVIGVCSHLFVPDPGGQETGKKKRRELEGGGAEKEQHQGILTAPRSFRCVSWSWSGAREVWPGRVAWRKKFNAGRAELPETTRSRTMGSG